MRQISGKPFQASKIILILPEVVIILTPFERKKIEVLSGLVMREFTTKEDLNPKKQVPLNLMFWHAQKP